MEVVINGKLTKYVTNALQAFGSHFSSIHTVPYFIPHHIMFLYFLICCSTTSYAHRDCRNVVVDDR